MAQQQSAEPTAGEIIVTAQKREQAINSVGLTITATSGATLIERGVVSTADLVKVVPGFTYTETPALTPVYTLRGVGLYDSGLASSPAVATYLDQVSFSSPVMSLGATLDLERLEVLKGPQGTLFGQSSTGGAINYIAAKPTDSFKAGMTGSYERFGKAEFTGFLSGPIGDVVRARLAGRITRGGDWQRSITRPNDDIGAKRQSVGRLLIEAEPSDALKLSLNVNGWIDKSDTQRSQFVKNALSIVAAPDARYPGAVVDPAAFAAITTPTSPNYDASFVSRQNLMFNRAAGLAGPVRQHGAIVSLGGPYGDGRSVPENARLADWGPDPDSPSDSNYYQIALNATYNLSDTLTLTSISSYQHVKIDQFAEYDGVTIRSAHIRFSGAMKAASQELRLEGDAANLHWMLGGNYEWNRSNELPRYAALEGSNGESLPGLIAEDVITSSRQTAKTVAVFGNVEAELAERLTVIAGARWTQTRRHSDQCMYSETDPVFSKLFGNADIVPGFGFYDLQTAFGLDPAGHVIVAPSQCVTFNDTVAPTDPAYLRPIIEPFRIKLNEDNISWRLGMNYKFDQGTLIYATVSQGYKAGIIGNMLAAFASQYIPAKQEKVIAYEAGIKAPLFDRKVQFNAAAFYYDYSDKQLRARIQQLFGPQELIVNIAKSRVYGLEGELTLAPMEGLSLSASATYLKSEVTKSLGQSETRAIYNQAGYQGDFKGSRLPYTPAFSAVLDGSYTHQLGSDLDGFVGSTLTYQGRDNATFQTDIVRADDFFRRAHAVLDLRAGIAAKNDSWRLTAFGRNVTNKFYETAFFYTDMIIRYTGMPTVYGISLELRFGS